MCRKYAQRLDFHFNAWLDFLYSHACSFLKNCYLMMMQYYQEIIPDVVGFQIVQDTLI